MATSEKTFEQFKPDAHLWITLSSGEYYPDVLTRACDLYQPVLVLFGQLITSAFSSIELLKAIMDVRDSWMRIQLCRVFRKYVSPETPVEMLKRKVDTTNVIKHYGMRFRKITDVQRAFASRPPRDEAICAVLWEYKDRGRSGYDLTESFVALVGQQLPTIRAVGPRRAGLDPSIGHYLPDYPNPKRPVDFVLFAPDDSVLAVGWARYDSDRGGAQEDDRPGQYRDAVGEVLGWAKTHQPTLKIVLLNDGPGLLLGSMWADYAKIESTSPNVRVMTLRMVPDRLTADWLLSQPRSKV